MLNVLMISYDFPPMGGSGVQRVMGLVKYLPFYGIRPIILTINRRSRSDRPEEDRQRRISPNVDVYGSPSFDLYTILRKLNLHSVNGRLWEKTSSYSIRHHRSLTTRFLEGTNKLIVPDSKILSWAPFAIWTAKSLLSKHKIHLVFSTSPWATAHLIAYLISRRYNIPMISDFRDPWTQGKYESTRFFPVKSLDLFLERAVIQHSRKVICVTKGMKEDFVRRCGLRHKNKFVVVTNGFDHEEFQSVASHTYHHHTILYAGKNYEGQGNIPVFLGKLDRIRQKHSLDIHFHYVGPDHKAVASYAASRGLDFVMVTPFLPHCEVVSYMKGASFLYLSQPDVPIPSLSGKLFEYLGAQRPIIAMATGNTELVQILKKTKSGFVFKNGEDVRLERYLKQQHAKYSDGKGLTRLRNSSLILQYDRKRLVGRIADLVRHVSRP